MSNNEAILEYIQTGKIKGLPTDLSTLTEADAVRYLNENKNVWQRMIRGQTLMTVVALSGRLQIPDETLATMRAVRIHQFNTVPWATDRKLFVSYYFNRDGDWARVTHRFDAERIVFDNSRIIDTQAFVHDLRLAGNSPTKVLEIVHRSLEKHAEEYVVQVRERLADAEALIELFTLLKERTQNLLP